MARTISPPQMPTVPHGHAQQHPHAHQHEHQRPLQGQPNPNQMMMQVVQMPDGQLGLAPWTPPAPLQQQVPQQGMGQMAPQPSWGGLALVMGGLGIAGWWAWKKWIKGEPKSSGSSFSDERQRSNYSGYSRRRSGEYRSSEVTNRSSRSAYNRLDERRSHRSRTRMLAEYKRYLDTQGITD